MHCDLFCTENVEDYNKYLTSKRVQTSIGIHLHYSNDYTKLKLYVFDFLGFSKLLIVLYT